MAAVILFVLICVGLYFLYLYMKKDQEKDDHYRELAYIIGHKEICNEYARESIKGPLSGYKKSRFTEPSIDQISNYFKSHPVKLAEAEKAFKEREKSRREYAEFRKREIIKSRVFAYDYEDMLFQIYAPEALDYGDSWSPRSLPKDYILQRIAEIMNVSTVEASIICDKLIEKKVLYNWGGINLSPMLWDDHNYKDPQWNVVSNLDMTLTKWMDAHGYEHKKN